MGHAFVSDLRRWDIVAGLCQSVGARTYVEVGCKDGQTTGRVLAQCPDLRAIAVDPWCQQEAGQDASRETYADWDFSKIETEFWKNVGAHRDRCEQWQATSEEAVGQIADPMHEIDSCIAERAENSQFCVVFIDALHDYESVKQDIALWWPLVRDGGYLVLHDYNHKWPGVMRAVAEAFPLFKVGLAPDSVAFVRKEVLQ